MPTLRPVQIPGFRSSRFTGLASGLAASLLLALLGTVVALPVLSTPAAAQAACSRLHYSNNVQLRNGSRYSRDWVRRISTATGNQRPIFVCQGNVQNAGAVRGHGRRPGLIVYNPGFMERLEKMNKWAPIGVLAHEVGHHFGPYQTSRNAWDRELGADEFSGCVLKTLGASLRDAQFTVGRALPYNRRGSRSHPPTKLRIQAVTRGYRNCQRGRYAAQPTVAGRALPRAIEQANRRPVQSQALQRTQRRSVMTDPARFASGQFLRRN